MLGDPAHDPRVPSVSVPGSLAERWPSVELVGDDLPMRGPPNTTDTQGRKASGAFRGFAFDSLALDGATPVFNSSADHDNGHTPAITADPSAI